MCKKEVLNLAKENAENIMAVFVGFGQIEAQINLILNLFFIKKEMRKIADDELWSNEFMFRIKIHLIGIVADMQGVKIKKERLNRLAELRNQFAHGAFLISKNGSELIIKNGKTVDSVSKKFEDYKKRLGEACDEIDRISKSLGLVTFKEIFNK